MKSLAIIATLIAGLTTQALAGSGTHPPKLNPGVTPKLAHKYVPKYDIVTAKVAPGIKFQNPAAAKGFDPQPDPPAGRIFQAPARR